MKIPVYKEKLARTKTSGGGAFLQAQVNSNAWGAMGTALSDVGDMVTKIGMEKYKIQATSDVNETIPLFVAALETIKVNHAKQTNPVEAEKKVKAKMMAVWKKFSNGNMKKTGEGTPYLSSNLSKRLFSTKASELVTKGILAWKKANNAHIVELNKLNETNAIRLNDKDASNTSLPPDVRDRAYEANFSQVSLYKKVEGQNQNFGNYIGMPSGKYAENAQMGTFSSKEFLTMQKKSLENIVTGISLNLIKSKTHPSMSVTEVLVKGDLKQLTEVDPILAKVWGKLDPQDKLDFIKKVRTLENNRKKDVEDAKKEKADVLKAGDEKLKIEIINADYSNPKAKAAALLKFKTLLKNKYFVKASEQKAIGSFFEEDETKETAKKTDMKVYNQLNILDRDNQLTTEQVNNLAGGLSQTHHIYWLNQVETERNEAAAYVKDNLINRGFYVDKLSKDTKNSKQLNNMRVAVSAAFGTWRQSPAGKKATHAETIAEGERLMAPYITQIQAIYKTAFDSDVEAFKTTYRDFPKFRPKNVAVARTYTGQYTLKNMMMYLVEKGTRSDPAFKSWLEIFQSYDGIVGAETWNK